MFTTEESVAIAAGHFFAGRIKTPKPRVLNAKINLKQAKRHPRVELTLSQQGSVNTAVINDVLR